MCCQAGPRSDEIVKICARCDGEPCAWAVPGVDILAIETVTMEVLNHDGLAAMLGEQAVIAFERDLWAQAQRFFGNAFLQDVHKGSARIIPTGRRFVLEGVDVAGVAGKKACLESLLAQLGVPEGSPSKRFPAPMLSARWTGQNTGRQRNRDMVEVRSDAVAQGSSDLEIAREVYRAIAEDRLFFQHERVCALAAPTNVLYLESLVRITVGDSVLLPGSFIPALEKLSLMRPFDCFVVSRTLEAIKAMLGTSLGCNVSALSARDDHWWQPVFLELESNPQAAARLVVEITESMPSSPVDARAFIKRLRRLGVRVAVDDFGAGFSADLADVCATDIIKIDRSYLRHARRGTRGLAELSRVTSIAQALAAIVVVEGVETPDDIQIARNAGLRWVQGYFLNAPAPDSQQAHS